MKSTFRHSLKSVLFITLVMAAVCSLTTLVAAQGAATVTGVVSDPTGAVIAGVSVTLTNVQTGDTYKGVTSDHGSYTITQVKPGPGYKIEFTHEGFKAVSRRRPLHERGQPRALRTPK